MQIFFCFLLHWQEVMSIKYNTKLLKRFHIYNVFSVKVKKYFDFRQFRGDYARFPLDKSSIL
jgi:hypothetical protein